MRVYPLQEKIIRGVYLNPIKAIKKSGSNIEW